MPKLVFKKKYFTYISVLVLMLFAAVWVKFNLTYLLVSHNVWPEGPERIEHLTLNYAVNMMIGELYVIAFVTAIKSTADWLREHKRLTDLEKEQMETQLLFLRNQVSPHFFFNTLNNIYSLALEKSSKTPDVILKLSEVMRYLLYETKNKRKSLKSELNCIQSYLDLEKLRHTKDLDVNMNITGDFKDKTIAPLLLLPFIENAFKHGARKNIGHVKIFIDLKVVDDFLYFSVTNPTPAKTKYKKSDNSFGGIGLTNVKKRLDLGYKEGDYDLDIRNDKKTFKVNLKIKVI
jgi:sensor histidine kinase YesM